MFCDSILAQTVEAFGSVISNNLNRVVKLLTSMTIILTVPMLVASIYGMNVELFRLFSYLRPNQSQVDTSAVAETWPIVNDGRHNSNTDLNQRCQP